MAEHQTPRRWKARHRGALSLALAVLASSLTPAGAPAAEKAIWGPVTMPGGGSPFPVYRRLGGGHAPALGQLRECRPHAAGEPHRPRRSRVPLARGARCPGAAGRSLRHQPCAAGDHFAGLGQRRPPHQPRPAPSGVRRLSDCGESQIPGRPAVDDLGRAQPGGQVPAQGKGARSGRAPTRGSSTRHT